VTDLVTLRRRAEVKALRINTLLMDRGTRAALPQQLAAAGYPPIADQTATKLMALDAFLGLWLELLPMTAGIYWPDSEPAE
jgi:hypothetical protein